MKPNLLYVRILQGNLANVAFDDLVRLLERLGYEPRRIRGDHFLLKHSERDTMLNLQPDRNGKANVYQVRQMRDAITKYHLELED